jgi:hypothetical protein
MWHPQHLTTPRPVTGIASLFFYFIITGTCSSPVKKTEITAVEIRHADHVALTSPTSGGARFLQFARGLRRVQVYAHHVKLLGVNVITVVKRIDTVLDFAKENSLEVKAEKYFIITLR